jgi:hypothetical protein
MRGLLESLELCIYCLRNQHLGFASVATTAYLRFSIESSLAAGKPHKMPTAL